MILAVRLARAEGYWLDGQPELARREAELADDVAGCGDAWERGAVAVWLRRCGSDRPPRGELAEPCQRQTRGLPGKGRSAVDRPGLPLRGGAGRWATRRRSGCCARRWPSSPTWVRRPPARLTRQKMRQLGIRSIPAGLRTATRADPLGLTQREREVLELICAGHTNAEIAARLYISAKTVDHHVSAVLAKLGAPTRSAAASHAARLGLAGPRS